jgi:hypothetical protein
MRQGGLLLPVLARLLHQLLLPLAAAAARQQQRHRGHAAAPASAALRSCCRACPAAGAPGQLLKAIAGQASGSIQGICCPAGVAVCI